MTYRTVFDAAHQSSPLLAFPGLGLLFIFSSLLLIWKPSLFQPLMPLGGRRLNARAFGIVALLFAIFWTVTGYMAVSSSQDRAAAELHDPKLSVVEGTVENFVPMPYEGHKMESFDVGGHHFSYSDYIIKPGFHNAASHGGPIRPGLQVRLSYVENDILRIEVAQ